MRCAGQESSTHKDSGRCVRCCESDELVFSSAGGEKRKVGGGECKKCIATAGLKARLLHNCCCTDRKKNPDVQGRGVLTHTPLSGCLCAMSCAFAALCVVQFNARMRVCFFFLYFASLSFLSPSFSSRDHILVCSHCFFLLWFPVASPLTIIIRLHSGIACGVSVLRCTCAFFCKNT
jgi:hypothetical protein